MQLVQDRVDQSDPVNYAEGVAGNRLLLPLDHPDPAHCILSGTGLDHTGSAQARDAMHAKLSSGELTDSMKMFKLGLEGGKPAAGQVGVAPEWFYNGDGSWVVPPGHPLEMPAFALDGGEEPEAAGIYLIGPTGQPFRIGWALANEFSDHVTERDNYLWLAPSKLRVASYGPEILVGDLPAVVRGPRRILRKDTVADGNNPCIVTGYGGYGISSEPDFHAIRDLWLRRGAIFVVTHLRGGGEYGAAWHRAGKLTRKQNVFDDFSGAAEWLVGNRYTNPRRLAISGRSNGGLLVGNMITLYPELFRAVVCQVPLLDMQRYHLLLAGASWKAEYGDPDNPDAVSYTHLTLPTIYSV